MSWAYVPGLAGELGMAPGRGGIDLRMPTPGHPPGPESHASADRDSVSRVGDS